MAGYVSRSTLQLVVVGIVSIAAISIGAATVTSTIDSGANGIGEGGGPPIEGQTPGSFGTPSNVTPGESAPNGTPPESPGAGIDPTRCVEELNSTPGTLGYFVAIGLVIYLIRRRYSSGAAMLSAYGLMPVVLVAYFLLTDCVSGAGPGVGNGTGGGGGGGGEAPVPPLDVPPAVLLGVFGVVIVAAAAVMVRASGDQSVEIQDEDEEAAGEGADVSDLAAAAGAAADRLEEHNVDVDNAVYRAWWEMTRLLDVPQPRSSTPGEFADAAVEVGMDRTDVDRLTTLFEEVRYGQRDAESREDDALEVFRAIEEEYGTDEGSRIDDVTGASADSPPPGEDTEAGGDDGSEDAGDADGAGDAEEGGDGR